LNVLNKNTLTHFHRHTHKNPRPRTHPDPSRQGRIPEDKSDVPGCELTCCQESWRPSRYLLIFVPGSFCPVYPALLIKSSPSSTLAAPEKECGFKSPLYHLSRTFVSCTHSCFTKHVTERGVSSVFSRVPGQLCAA
jgi:hypothetical protein